MSYVYSWLNFHEIRTFIVPHLNRLSLENVAFTMREKMARFQLVIYCPRNVTGSQYVISVGCIYCFLSL